VRREPIERACRKKYPKLAAWRAAGARTVLVLEDNDIQVSNANVVAEALLSVERGVECVLPDEIYLVETCPSRWWGHVVRIDDRNFFDYSYDEQSNRYWEIDPVSLVDLMKK
jgi:hypothetical protein